MKVGALLSLFFCVGFLIALSACSGNKIEGSVAADSTTSALRPLTAEERTQDFEQLLNLFKTFYAPYQYKEKNLNIQIDSTLKALQAKALTAQTDEELAGYVMQFGATLQDGHVQIVIENSASGIVRYRVPILITPVENKILIGDIKKELTEYSGMEVGDEVVSIDGKAPTEWLKTILKYRSNATPLANRHAVMYALNRPSYMTDLVPKSAIVEVAAVKPDGTRLSSSFAWEIERYSKEMDRIVSSQAGLDMSSPFAMDYNKAVDSHRLQMGQVNPIFLTAQTQAKYKFVKVYPSDAARAKFGLKDKETPPIYAALYNYQGKHILLVRIATYSPSDYKTSAYMKAYMALLSEYENLADVLVLDQTHNPGGSYCAEFYNIFANDNDVQCVGQLHADRKWINDLKINWPKELLDENPMAYPYDITASVAWGSVVEKTYDAGKFLTEPVPLFSGSSRTRATAYQWKKPMLVLIDSLAGSCGDLFPMLVKANKRAKLFGENTMGLGGNVEEVGQLNHSRIQVRMTRSLFFPLRPDGAYVTEDYVENHGVAPDYPYSISVQDFRSGMVDYVKTFSDQAVKL